MRTVSILLAAALFAACTQPERPLDRDEATRLAGRLGRDQRAYERLAEGEAGHTWPALVALLENDKTTPRARVAAIEILGKKADATVRLPAATYDALGHESPDVRRAAFRVIAENGNPSDRWRLDGAIERENDTAAKEEMTKVLADIVIHERAWHRDVLKSPTANQQDRALAIRALGHHANPEDVPAIVEHFESTTETLPRYEAIIALSRIGGPVAKGLIREQLGSEDAFLRSAAAVAQITVKDPEAIGGLFDRLKHDNVFDIRVTAVMALSAIDTPEATKALLEGCANQQPKNPKVTNACNAARKEIAAKG